jgi:hypothetical protein
MLGAQKEKARNRFRPEKGGHGIAPSAHNVTVPNFASGVNHLRGRANETARHAGVVNVGNGNPPPSRPHEN